MYFVSVLNGLLQSDGSKTLSGMLRHMAVVLTVSSLSRFLSRPVWSAAGLEEVRYRQFRAQVKPRVEQAEGSSPGNRRNRLPDHGWFDLCETLLMEGWEWVWRALLDHGRQNGAGYSLFQAVYLLEGHQFQLTPQTNCQKAECRQNQEPFFSKVDLVVKAVEDFEAFPDTHTHVIFDSWYLNKRLWKAVWKRGWDLSGGLKSNHSIRLADSQGIVSWPVVSKYARSLDAEDFQKIFWPNQEGGHTVHAHLLGTRVKKLGACQVLIIREKPNDPDSSTRFYATTSLKDTHAQVIAAIAKRWAVETLFADFKELMGSDQYQLHSAEAIRRFLALGLCLYQYLDSLRQRLQLIEHRHLPLGEVRAWVLERHEYQQLDWI
jgi:hypothetical protein